MPCLHGLKEIGSNANLFFILGVDNSRRICYNDYSKREEDARMADWYMNPENHAEDYEELLALLTEEAED